MNTMHQFSALKYTIIDEGHLLLSDKLLGQFVPSYSISLFSSVLCSISSGVVVIMLLCCAYQKEKADACPLRDRPRHAT